MATFHVVPRGDAVTHDVHSHGNCACVVDVRLVPSDDRLSGQDVWYYHRRVSIEEAMLPAPQRVETEAA